jgi:adenylate cyclase
VNVASRLEGINKQFGTAICVSDSVVNAVGGEILVRPLRRVVVKGREQRFMIYELLGIVGSDDPELRPAFNSIELSEMTRTASDSFEAGKFHEAATAYQQILDRYPGDPVATAMLNMPELANIEGQGRVEPARSGTPSQSHARSR